MTHVDAPPNAVLRFIRRAGLEAPALIGLELAWPLRFFLQQGLTAVAPLFGGWGARDPLTHLLDDSAAWERWRRVLADDHEAS